MPHPYLLDLNPDDRCQGEWMLEHRQSQTGVFSASCEDNCHVIRFYSTTYLTSSLSSYWALCFNPGTLDLIYYFLLCFLWLLWACCKLHNGYYNPFKSMTAQLPAQQISSFNASGFFSCFIQIYIPGIFHSCEKPGSEPVLVRGSMLFLGLSRFLWALWPDVEQQPPQNKWRTVAASLSAGARGPASTHSTLYQVCTNKYINRNTDTNWMQTCALTNTACKWICSCLLSILLKPYDSHSIGSISVFIKYKQWQCTILDLGIIYY